MSSVCTMSNKEELIYGRYDTTKMSVCEVKSLVWRYYESYIDNFSLFWFRMVSG